MNDLIYALRQFVRQPGFTIVAVLALALGIGANTAIFSLVNGVLLRPLPYPDPERIVFFSGINPPQGITDSNISVPDYESWRTQSQAFAETATFITGNAVLSGANNETERVPRAAVSDRFFAVLGLQPTLGRNFLPAEVRPGGEPVAILSHALWQRRFGADPAILNRKIMVNGRSLPVVGVMPAGFEFPDRAQLWTSLGLNPAEERRDDRSISALARLRPEVSLIQAQARVSAINAQLAQTAKETNAGWDVRLVRLHDRLVNEVRPSLLALLAAVAFVLLIACANVANLLLARAAGRQREIAVRAAMGASRARLIRQLLTESLLLALLGGTLGSILSIWLTELLSSLNPEDLPGAGAMHLDLRVLAFTVAITCLTGLLFGLAPALQSSRLDLNRALKEGGRGGTGESHARNRFRSFLLVSEVALSLILLVGAGLLIRSFLRLRNVEPGFNPARVLTMSVSLVGPKYNEIPPTQIFTRELIERVRALPGVTSVGTTLSLPLGGSNYSVGRSFIPLGRPLIPEESTNAMYSFASPDYFRTLEIPLFAGRFFRESDTQTAPPVVIINRTMAQRAFGSAAAAIGKRITIWRDEKFPREIVGVIGDTKTATLEAANDDQMYVPPAQDQGWGRVSLAVRTSGDPNALTPEIRRVLGALDPEQSIYNVQTLEEIVSKSTGSREMAMLVFSVFAATALLLATLGIYGVMAYSVTQRTQEIGIRMALGARPRDVLALVVRQGLALASLGIGAGLVGAFFLTRVMASLLFGVGANDPATFLGLSLLLFVTAFLACYLPARRAAKVDPMIALRYE